MATAKPPPLLVAPFNIPTDAWLIEDGDEEIFLLYSRLQSLDTAWGLKGLEANASELGSVDSRQGELLVQIEFGPAQLGGEDISCSSLPPPSSREDRDKSTERKRKKSRKLGVDNSIEIRLFQDITGLRSRNGDTGSVLWRASICLARLLLSGLHSPTSDSFLSSSAFSTCHVIELGAGTGILSVIFAPFVHKYTATDLPSLIPLIRKNQAHNIPAQYLQKVSAEELDWVQLHDAPLHLRQKIFQSIISPPASQLAPAEPKKSLRKGKKNSSPMLPESLCPGRLILAVDCIYNPALIVPLLETIDYLASQSDFASESGNATPITVLIVLELRSEEVAREFIHKWLSLQSGWNIWNVPLLGPKYTMWIGQRGKVIY